MINQKETLNLVQLYLKLDDLLKNLYGRLGKIKKYPSFLRSMWQGLEQDESEHIIYWQYLEDQRYNLAIFTHEELKQNIKKLEKLISLMDNLLCGLEGASVTYEECFDQTVNVEFEALISPMQRVFYNHDIILKDEIFNPMHEYELHLKRITDVAIKLYPENSIKFTLVDSLLRIKDEKDNMLMEVVSDSLTGVKSRKYFFDNADFLLRVAKREKKPLALIMIDVNDFKAINDEYGHLAGDKVLKKIGSLIKKSVRTTDIAARYGGDEFSLVLYDQDDEKTGIFLNRLKKEISNLRISLARNRSITPGISAGYIISRPDTDNSLRRLISQADKRMYKEKNELHNI
ncbi:GGDEF domain-containing protein [Elusimicrobiota bacterium]